MNNTKTDLIQIFLTGVNYGFVPIQEIKLYYLVYCDMPSIENYFLFGKKFSEKPTLTGFIKYWRRFKMSYPNVKIIYKSQQNAKTI